MNILQFPFHVSLQNWCLFCPYSTCQFELATFQVLGGYRFGESRSRHSPLRTTAVLNIKPRSCLCRWEVTQESKTKKI